MQTILADRLPIVREAVSRCFDTHQCGLDLETTSLDQFTASIVGYGLAPTPEVGYYIPVQHRGVIGQPEHTEVWELLAPLLAAEHVKKVVFNGSYDITILQLHGYQVNNVFDQMLMMQLKMMGVAGSFGLKSLASRYLGLAMPEFGSLVKRGQTFADVPLAAAAAYGGADAAATLALHYRYHCFEDRRDALLEMEQQLLWVLIRMQLEGTPVDAAILEAQRPLLQGQLQALQRQVDHLTQRVDFPILSNQTVSEYLFKISGCDTSVTQLGKNGYYSVAAGVLERLDHPVARLVVEYRQVSKLMSTYVDGLLNSIRADGRVRTTYGQIRSTGRMSSDSPNLQNIPYGEMHGANIRQAFVAPPGYSWLKGDISQAELRILAHVSQDAALRRVYQEGGDIHHETAALLLAAQGQQRAVTKSDRNAAKPINFGMVYGLTASGVAAEAGISMGAAQRFVNSFFTRFPGIRRYYDDTMSALKSKGYVETWTGRRRYMPPHWFTVAVNTPIQGGAADVFKYALVALDKFLEGRQSRLVLQVHDEVGILLHDDERHLLPDIKRVMETAVQLSVPLEVEFSIGPDWAHLQEIHSG